MSEKYEVFEDLPSALSQVYIMMNKIYPDSKFILSLRRDENIWLESMRKHARVKLWEGHCKVYDNYQVTGNEKLFLAAYLNHVREVRAFFNTDEMRGRGMEMVIDNLQGSGEDTWTRLVDFLAVEIRGSVKTLGHFPKSNGGNNWGNRDPFGFVCIRYRRYRT